jgi:hypothetical protein
MVRNVGVLPWARSALGKEMRRVTRMLSKAVRVNIIRCSCARYARINIRRKQAKYNSECTVPDQLGDFRSGGNSSKPYLSMYRDKKFGK